MIYLLLGECDKEWRVVNKKQYKDLICCVRGPTKDTTVKALETLRRDIGVDSMVNVFHKNLWHSGWDNLTVQWCTCILINALISIIDNTTQFSWFSKKMSCLKNESTN